MVGSRGHDALASALLGSVSCGVLPESKRPVRSSTGSPQCQWERTERSLIAFAESITTRRSRPGRVQRSLIRRLSAATSAAAVTGSVSSSAASRSSASLCVAPFPAMAIVALASCV